MYRHSPKFPEEGVGRIYPGNMGWAGADRQPTLVAASAGHGLTHILVL